MFSVKTDRYLEKIFRQFDETTLFPDDIRRWGLGYMAIFLADTTNHEAAGGVVLFREYAEYRFKIEHLVLRHTDPTTPQAQTQQDVCEALGETHTVLDNAWADIEGLLCPEEPPTEAEIRKIMATYPKNDHVLRSSGRLDNSTNF